MDPKVKGTEMEVEKEDVKSKEKKIEYPMETKAVCSEDILRCLDRACGALNNFLAKVLYEEMMKIFEEKYKLDVKTMDIQPMLQLFKNWSMSVQMMYYSNVMQTLGIPDGIDLTPPKKQEKLPRPPAPSK